MVFALPFRQAEYFRIELKNYIAIYGLPLQSGKKHDRTTAANREGRYFEGTFSGLQALMAALQARYK